MNVNVLPKDSLNFKMILAGRIDAYPVAELVGYEIVNTFFTPEEASLFTNHPKTLNEGGVYILLSKRISNAQEIADAFDLGIVALKASGRYDEIMSEFLYR